MKDSLQKALGIMHLNKSAFTKFKEKVEDFNLFANRYLL